MGRCKGLSPWKDLKVKKNIFTSQSRCEGVEKDVREGLGRKAAGEQGPSHSDVGKTGRRDG